MPTYAFECEKCGKQFEEIISLSDFSKQKSSVRCPACQSDKVKQLLTTFHTITTKKS